MFCTLGQPIVVLILNKLFIGIFIYLKSRRKIFYGTNMVTYNDVLIRCIILKGD